MNAHRLHRKPVAELPAELVARHELPEPRMERDHVIVLEIDLDEGFPVVMTVVRFDVIEHVAREIEVGPSGDRGQIAANIPRTRKQQPLPVL